MTLIKLPGTQHRNEDYSLAPEVVEQLWNMEDRHFWHKARNAWILDALRANDLQPSAQILDVGCGSGAVARALAGAGYSVTGVDTAEHLVSKAQARCPESRFVVGDVGALPEGWQGPFGAIGFFDVLEHLDRPEELLRGATKWARAGAVVIATVPALRSLHSIVDDLSGHKRRYERGEITALFESVGIGAVVEYGIFASTLGIQRLERRNPRTTEQLGAEERSDIMQRALRVPRFPINAALSLVVSAERFLGLEAAKNRMGATVLAVGRLGLSNHAGERT